MIDMEKKIEELKGQIEEVNLNYQTILATIDWQLNRSFFLYIYIGLAFLDEGIQCFSLLKTHKCRYLNKCRKIVCSLKKAKLSKWTQCFWKRRKFATKLYIKPIVRNHVGTLELTQAKDFSEIPFSLKSGLKTLLILHQIWIKG